MSSQDPKDANKRAPGLGEDPLSSDELLDRTFYRGPAPAPVKKPKPTHYRVVSISLYNEDIERLDAMVAELKKRGVTKANRSQLIRFALDTVDLNALPKGY
ncbi:MAG: hypothetical protein AAFU79_35880 [Myxococcota bacterium]